MNCTGAPAYVWLLCVLYVALLMNCLPYDFLKSKTPIEALTGQQPDISALLQFYFYEPVYYKVPKQHFLSESEENSGRLW